MISTAPVSALTTTSQICVPYGALAIGSFWSEMPASRPCSSHGRSVRVAEAAATSNNAELAIGAGAPATGARQIEIDLARLEQNTRDLVALVDDVVGRVADDRRGGFIERPECEPPPATAPTVFWATSTLSNGTPSHSVTSCAKLVSWPCPDTIHCQLDPTLGQYRDLGALARRA